MVSVYVCTKMLCFIFSLDCSTIFNLCKVSICLQSCFVEISSCLRDCNGHDDWHLYMLYIHALLSLTAHAPCTSSLMKTCFIMIIPVYMLSIFVNLYGHMPHAPYYMYYFLFCLIMLFVNLYDHAPSVHHCMYVCMYIAMELCEPS